MWSRGPFHLWHKSPVTKTVLQLSLSSSSASATASPIFGPVTWDLERFRIMDLAKGGVSTKDVSLYLRALHAIDYVNILALTVSGVPLWYDDVRAVSYCFAIVPHSLFFCFPVRWEMGAVAN